MPRVLLTLVACVLGLVVYCGNLNFQLHTHAAEQGGEKCPPNALHTICGGPHMERDYVLGKALECLLGPAAVRPAVPTRGFEDLWEIDAGSEIFHIAQSVAQQAENSEGRSGDMPTTGLAVIRKNACVKVCESISRHFAKFTFFSLVEWHTYDECSSALS